MQPLLSKYNAKVLTAAFNTNYPIILNEEMHENFARSATLCYNVGWQVNSLSQGSYCPIRLPSSQSLTNH